MPVIPSNIIYFLKKEVSEEKGESKHTSHSRGEDTCFKIFFAHDSDISALKFCRFQHYKCVAKSFYLFIYFVTCIVWCLLTLELSRCEDVPGRRGVSLSTVLVSLRCISGTVLWESPASQGFVHQ
ncbi:hypothetical protein CCH79_00011058, partial [Gambusia affinis]